MSHLSASVTHNEYTNNPTNEKRFDEPQSFSSLTAVKEGFFAPYKSNKPATWIIFTLVGLVISAGFMFASSIAAASASESNPGTVSAIIGDALAFVAVLVGFYFFIGLTQGFIRGTHFVSPHYNDLFVSDAKTIFRSYGATILLGLVTLLLTLPLLALNFLVVIVGVPVPKFFSIGVIILVVAIVALLRLFFAYTIYAIIDSKMKVLDSFMLSTKIVSRNFVSSLLLLVFTTLILSAPAILIGYLPMMSIDNISETFTAILWVVVAILTILLFPATQAAYVYAYRKSTNGPVPVGGKYTTDGDMVSLASEDTEVTVDEDVDVHLDEEADSLVEEEVESETLKTSIDVTDKDGDGKITKKDEETL